jgi:DNA-binding NtrC family response regulator
MVEHSILFIDDDPGILSSLKRLFRDKGYSILAFTDGNQGLKALDGKDVAVMVVDYKMPGLSGIEVLQKARDISPDTIRVMMTGALDLELALEAIRSGEVYRIVRKPWNDLELKATIDQCFEKYNLIQENYRLQERLLDQTKLEMIKAVVVTLNHEINNSLNCLSLDIDILNRAFTKNETPQDYGELLSEMRASYKQIGDLIMKLRNIEEIKLTKYVNETMMLDHRASK